MTWLDDRLEHTLRRGREWLTGSKSNIQELKDKATTAVADLLAASSGTSKNPPVVRLPNGDYIWGNPYQAMSPERLDSPEGYAMAQQRHLQRQLAAQRQANG